MPISSLYGTSLISLLSYQATWLWSNQKRREVTWPFQVWEPSECWDLSVLWPRFKDWRFRFNLWWQPSLCWRTPFLCLSFSSSSLLLEASISSVACSCKDVCLLRQEEWNMTSLEKTSSVVMTPTVETKKVPHLSSSVVREPSIQTMMWPILITSSGLCSWCSSVSLLKAGVRSW